MAYRLSPISAFPATEGKVYPDVFRSNTNAFWVEGIGVVASLSADAEIHYVFHVPTPLPSGTAKLEVLAASNSTSGSAYCNPKWKSVAVEEDFDLAVGSLNAEGSTVITWSAGDANVLKQSKITLDADTVVADEFIVMRFVLESTSWSLAVKSIWLPSVIWE